MPARKKTQQRATMSVHQVVAYNFRRARDLLGWTQQETSDALEPYLGVKLRQAGVSAIEKTYDSPRRRNIDVAEVVGFARGFKLPLGWFFVPPNEHGADLIEPAPEEYGRYTNIADLIALMVGSPDGHQLILDRLADFDTTDHTAMWDALRLVYEGTPEAHVQDQLNLRRQAVRDVSLAKFASHNDEVIIGMAALLVELVKLTPQGLEHLKDVDPQAALQRLAEGDQIVQPLIEQDRQKRKLAPDLPTRYDELPREELIRLLEASKDPSVDDKS